MALQVDTTLDNATLALAIVTGFLALGTIGTAIAALRQARSTDTSVSLQREELEAVKAQAKLTEDQLKLAREQFEAARDADRAKLQIAAGFAQPDVIQGAVRYVSGREPAYDIEVWGRSSAGYYRGKIPGFMSPQVQYGHAITPDNPLKLTQLDAEAVARWPFPEADRQTVVVEGESFVCVTWRTHDGYRGKQWYHQLPGQQPEDHGPDLEPGPKP